MKKKLVSYLILACSVFGLAMVGSCKDYEDEFKGYRSEINNLKTNDGTLKARIDSVSNAIQNIKSCACDPNLKARLDRLYDFLGEIASDSTGLTIQYQGGLSYVLNEMNKQIADAAAKAYTDSVDSVLGKRIDELQCMWPDTLYKAFVKSHLVHDSLRLISDSIRLTEDSIRLYRDSVAIDSIIKQLNALSATHAKYVDSITLADSIKAVEMRYMKADSIIRDSLKILYERVEGIADSVKNLWNRVDTLYDVENKRITSLYVQGAMNPIFGSFALPVGIKSNILATYYGKATKSSSFPATNMDDLSALLDEGMQLSDDEAAVIGMINQVSTTSGEALAGKDEGNAGRIFLTINPNEVELDSTYKFTFVTSDGAETKATIGELVPSTEKLSFGLKTKAASETGFYEAPVTIAAEDADGLSPKLAVTKEQLKSIAKDVVSYKDGINLAGIGGAVFKLAQTSLDANAVKVEWQDKLGKHSVTSYYDLAVTAIKPLSYNALDGISISKRLPTINNISELSIDLSSITFNNIEFDDINFSIDGATAHISFDSIKFDTTGIVTITARIPNKIDIPTGDVIGYKDTVYAVDGLSAILSDIQDTFNGKAITWSGNVNAAIDDLVGKINNEVNTKINGLFADIEGKLNTPIQNLINDVKNQINSSLSGFNGYFNKMNSLIDRINNLTNKVNSKLGADLGRFVLPMVAYEGADGSMHLMSNDKVVPSSFAAGDGGIKLYLTSYTAELLAPAYKKYIAVVDYVKPDGSTHDASVAQALNNDNEYFNTVIDGAQFAVPFAPTQKGTYTIYYSAIDYSGFIASGRFYVTVK